MGRRETGVSLPAMTADGCGKQLWIDERFAVTVVQSDFARRSGPHPIWRHSPSNDGRLSTPYGATFPSRAGEGERATFFMNARSAGALDRYGAVVRSVVRPHSIARRLKQEPSASLGLVDPGFKEARRRDVAVTVADIVNLAHGGRQALIVVA